MIYNGWVGQGNDQGLQEKAVRACIDVRVIHLFAQDGVTDRLKYRWV